MKRKIFILLNTVVIVASLATIASAQWYRGNVKEILRRLEEDTDRFTKSLDNDLDRSRLNGTRAEDEINRYVHDFEEATDHLKNRFDDREASPRLAREVLARGRSIDGFMRHNRLGRSVDVGLGARTAESGSSGKRVPHRVALVSF